MSRMCPDAGTHQDTECFTFQQQKRFVALTI